MGYESKLLIGDASPVALPDGTYVQTIATYDLCVMGHGGAWGALLNASKAERVDNRDFYSYSLGYDGDDPAHKDLYGEPLLPLDLDHTIEALEASDPEYRRIPPALALLRSLRDIRDQYGDLVVLHYGH